MKYSLLTTAALILGCSSLFSADREMRIRLKDGSFSIGQLVESPHPGRIGWSTEGFEDPFHFDLKAIRSVTAVFRDGEGSAYPETGQLFELSDGSQIAGQLLEITADYVLVESPILGKLKISRSRVLSFTDAGYAGQVVYSGPKDDGTWRSLGTETDWEFEAGTLIANKQDASIIGNVEIPAKAQVNLVLTWKGVADFVFSFGTTDGRSPMRGGQIPAAARLEVWDKQLALVREVPGNADIALISDLTGANSRIELTLFIDQQAGTITACDAHGRTLETIKAVSTEAAIRGSAHLVNHGPSLTLEHFEIREWDGRSSAAEAIGNLSVIDSDGEVISGAVSSYSANEKTVEITLDADSETMTLPLSSIRRADLAPVKKQDAGVEDDTDSQSNSEDPDAQTDAGSGAEVEGQDVSKKALETEAASNADATGFNELFAASDPDQESGGESDAESSESAPPDFMLVEVILMDRTRLFGRWLTGRDSSLGLEVAGITLAEANNDSGVRFVADDVSGVIGTTSRYANDRGTHKNGTLKLENTQLTGYLAKESPEESQTALHWQPFSSINASQILPSASGAIVYRKSLPNVVTARRNNAANPKAAAPMVQIFLGGATPDSKTPRTSKKSELSAEAREIMFRSGDAIDGVVRGIDERGMKFESDQTTNTYAEHAQIQSIWLNRLRKSNETSNEKLKRLMTVPRSMKSDPPTHLLIAVTGDYLRGRLVGLDEEFVIVEVRLELMKIPRQQVAQIIWLHDRDWDEKQQKKVKGAGEEQTVASEEIESPFQVHGIYGKDRGLTFQPQSMNEGVLSGDSALLGDCSVDLNQISQLLFGRNIALRVREFREDPWTLSLAQYPRVYLEGESESGQPNMGMQSPLIGKKAPEFALSSLDGQLFRLSKNRDRIVVLDFWASWCGPCVQTMPQVEKVVEEFGPDRVQLVAVNIQEAKTRVQAAVERLGLTANVLLDVDGQVAAAYQANAIPQTVIIDRTGVVSHLFVGGGTRFINQFREALETATGVATQ